jgi:hypothetical protein
MVSADFGAETVFLEPSRAHSASNIRGMTAAHKKPAGGPIYRAALQARGEQTCGGHFLPDLRLPAVAVGLSITDSGLRFAGSRHCIDTAAFDGHCDERGQHPAMSLDDLRLTRVRFNRCHLLGPQRIHR